MSTPGTGANSGGDYNQFGNNFGNDGSGGYGGYESYGGYGSYPGAGGVPPQYGGETLPEQSNGMAVAALIVSIIALVATLSVIGLPLGFIIGVIGVVVSIIAIVKARKIRGPRRRMGMSIASLVMSLLAIVLSIGFVVFVTAVFSSSGLMECATLGDQAAIERCVEDVLNT